MSRSNTRQFRQNAQSPSSLAFGLFNFSRRRRVATPAPNDSEPSEFEELDSELGVDSDNDSEEDSEEEQEDDNDEHEYYPPPFSELKGSSAI